MRELNLTEKYVLFLILHEVKDRWSKNRVYQDLQTWLNEEMSIIERRRSALAHIRQLIYECENQCDEIQV